jgi:hypothetical protein
MLAARSSFSTFVLNGSIHVVGSHDRRQPTASVERHDVISDNWSVVGNMHQAKFAFAAHAMVVDLNLI